MSSSDASYNLDSGFGPKLLDVHDVAALLHVSEGWVRDHCNGHEPQLPAMKFGPGKSALVRFQLSDVQEFVEKERIKAQARRKGSPKLGS